MADNRLPIDEITARVEADIAAEREQAHAIVAASTTAAVEETPEVERLRQDNERMHALITRVLEARNQAREFMTIWSDPRKLPELIQEVYMSHPDVQDLKKKLGEEQAQRAARLIAHMALTYEIHPLIRGMIYAWDQDGKVIVEVGYRGYSEMLKRDGMDFDTRPMTDDECVIHEVGKQDRGYLCFVHDWDRADRFVKHGEPVPPPYRGVGIWKPSYQVPKTKSGDWRAEINALKDAARRALSFAVTRTADAQTLDFVYSVTDDAWIMPIEIADWLKFPSIVRRFEEYLSSLNITDEEFNAHLGQDWRYTTLQPDEIKVKADECAAARNNAIDGVFEEKVAEPATEVPTEAPEPEVPAVFEAPKEIKPASKRASKTRRKPAKPAEQAMCENCGVEPGEETPFGVYCKTCAERKAEADAKKTA
jgi:hypothetical protein